MLGRLSFQYTHPLSRIRENYIIQCIETEEIVKVSESRVQMEASLISNLVGKSKNITDIPYKSFKSFAELKLPYLYRKDKINKSMDKKERDYWKSVFSQRKAEFKKNKDKK